MAGVPSWSQTLPDPSFYAKEALSRAYTAQADAAASAQQQQNKEREEMWKRAQTPLSEDSTREMFAAKWGDEVADNRIKDLHSVGAFRDVGGKKFTTPFDIEFWNRHWNSDQETRNQMYLRDLPFMIDFEEKNSAKLIEQMKKLQPSGGAQFATGTSADLEDVKMQQKREELKQQLYQSMNKREGMWKKYILMNPQGAHQAGMSIMPKVDATEHSRSYMPPAPGYLSGKELPSVESVRSGAASGLNQAANALHSEGMSELGNNLSDVFAELLPGLPKGISDEILKLMQGISPKDISEGRTESLNGLVAGIRRVIQSTESFPPELEKKFKEVGMDSDTAKAKYAKFVSDQIRKAITTVSMIANNVGDAEDRGRARGMISTVIADTMDAIRNPLPMLAEHYDLPGKMEKAASQSVSDQYTGEPLIPESVKGSSLFPGGGWIKPTANDNLSLIYGDRGSAKQAPPPPTQIIFGLPR